MAAENHLRFRTGPQNKTQQDYRWVNDISYVDSKDREHSLSVIECRENKPGPDGQRQTTRFKWVTNFTVKAKHVIPLANEGGRHRWKTVSPVA